MRTWIAAFVLAVATVIGAAAIPSRAADPPSLGGRLLVATNAMQDPRFVRTVILMITHDRSGAFGLIINKPVETTSFAELMRRLGDGALKAADGDVVLHYGGPVERERGFVIHGPDFNAAETITVDRRFAMTASREAIRALAQGRGPRQSLVAFGYAGWGPGQLEEEIKGGSWVVIDADEKAVFGPDAAGKWRRAFEKRGLDL